MTSHLVAISCAREERPHAEMLKAFLEEELGETLLDESGNAGQAAVYFYLDDSRAGSRKPESQAALIKRVEKIYKPCGVMVAIIGANYPVRSIAAGEAHFLANRRCPRDVVMLLPGQGIPAGTDVRTDIAPDWVSADPRNSEGFEHLRSIAKRIIASLGPLKPPHPRKARGLVNGVRPPIKRHLDGLEYVFAGHPVEATEGILSSAVFLGRLEQAQRAALVATALMDLRAIAADEAESRRAPESNVEPATFAELQKHANHLLCQLATEREQELVWADFPLGLRVKLLLRLENYFFRHTMERSKGTPVGRLPFVPLVEALQDIVLQDLGRKPATFPRYRRVILHQNGAQIAQELSNRQWLCADRPWKVVSPRGLGQLEQLRADVERDITTQPRPL